MTEPVPVMCVWLGEAWPVVELIKGPLPRQARYDRDVQR